MSITVAAATRHSYQENQEQLRHLWLTSGQVFWNPLVGGICKEDSIIIIIMAPEVMTLITRCKMAHGSGGCVAADGGDVRELTPL